MKARAWLGGAVAAMLATIAPVAAQIPDSVLQRNECRLAHQILTLGQPANQREWALDVIDRCPELGGEALASLVRDHRLEDQPGGELEEVVRSTRFLVASEIFQAATEVALDPGAATVARIQAIRILDTQLFPGSVDSFEAFRDAGPTMGGVLVETAARSDRLEPEVLEATEDRLRGLLAEPDLPAGVRNAATRLLPRILVAAHCDLGEISLAACLALVEERLPPG